MASASTTSASSRKGNNTSVRSRISNLSRRALSTLRPGSRSSSRSTRSNPEDEIWNLGDQCETVSLVTMRQEEALESEVVQELPIGTACEIVELGEGRRVKVSTGEESGWISCRTKANEALIVKRKQGVQFAIEDFEVGGTHEVKSMVTVRCGETLDSEVKTELKPGTLVKILELGTVNKRRARISAEPIEGWISLATKQGELLIGKVSEQRSAGGEGLFGVSSSKVKVLLEAARAGDLDAIKQVAEPRASMMSRFQARPTLNCSDIRGKTPLIYAAAFGNKAVVEYLLSKSEVDINAMDDTQKSAMHHASKRARKRREGAYDTVQAEIVHMLIQAKASIEARDHNGCTALMFAVANGDEGVAQVLLKAGANMNVRDFEGHTPLDYAANFGHTTLVTILRNAGAVADESEEEPPPTPAPAPEEKKSSIAASVPASVASTKADDDASTTAPSSSASMSLSPKGKKSTRRTTKKGDEDVGSITASATPKKAGKKAGAKKAGKKGAKVGKETSMPSGMHEMREAQAKQEETKTKAIEVEAVPVAEEDSEEVKLERARKKLQAVVDAGPSRKELQSAIEAAQAAGVEKESLDAANKTLAQMKARADARDALASAINALDVAMLKAAIKTGKEVGGVDEDVEAAEKVLAVEEPKHLARGKLQAAADAGDMAGLKDAVAEGDKLGLPASELKRYKEMLEGAENREKAQQALTEAIAKKDIQTLKFAIQQAKDQGINTAEAEQVVAVEEPKMKAREKLAEACASCNTEKLKAAIEEAKGVGLSADEMAEAEAALKQEAVKDELLSKVKAQMEESKSVDTHSIEALRAAKDKLSACILEAKEAGVSEVLLGDAELRRRKIHNGIEDLKGSIRVFCRVRPLSSKETGQGDTNIANMADAMTVEVQGVKFGFDAVFMPGKQEEVFEDCRDLVQSAIDGYNVTMFAYGQTGAGKTYTMYGSKNDPGTSPRTIMEIFRVTAQQSDRYQFTVMGSMLELYRNDLIDLLAKDGHKAAKKLNVRQEKSGMVQIEHLTEEICEDEKQLSTLLERGNAQRTVAATAMNSESSRSHLVLIIKIVSVNRETKDQLFGKILICDLAGSERLKKSQVTNEMQKEAIEINKSLTALGDVIEALTKANKQIPYRNHKLTQLMQDSLGGSAKTLMFVNCSPASSNVDETLMSLKYATRAKQIKNTATKKKQQE
eukprot:TRINITY_DN21177_c0_g1_i2.p1 TRINITY_DN21177_c0_g1~~TRINITY_DN21177_c0_g1_i2.p1  ORF type:complete len:1189 (+),score=375.48 TRINITY_DN21177_c0_g1_i2:67-3633(+)